MRLTNLSTVLSLGMLSGMPSAIPVEDKPLFHLLALGESITAGFASNPEDGSRKYLWGLLRNAGYQVNHIGSHMHDGEHEGYPGRKILEVRSEFEKNGFLDRKPNIMLIHMGTNNCVQHKDYKTGANDLGAFADYLLEQIPGVTIVMSTLGPLSDLDANTRCQSTLNHDICNKVKEMQAAEKNVHMADFAENLHYTIKCISQDDQLWDLWDL